MSTSGSAPRPLSAPLALAATAAGVLAMVGGAAVLAATGLSLRANFAIASLLVAVPPLLAVAAVRPPVATGIGLTRTTARVLGLSTVIGAGLWVLSLGLMEAQSALIPPPPEYLQAFRRIHEALRPSGPMDAFVSLAAIALFPALGEEVAVRGVLLPSLRPALGAGGAVAASALAFAAMHFDAYRFTFTLVLGLALGAMRLATGSLLAPIVAHATVNALTFALAPLVDDPSATSYEARPLLGLALLVAGALVSTPLLQALGRSVDSKGPAA